MKIEKVKLINHGYAGLEVHGVMPKLKGKLMVMDHEIVLRSIPVPAVLREVCVQLRYSLLVLAGYWISPYNKFYDFEEYKSVPIKEGAKTEGAELIMRGLLNNTEITGVTIRENGFLLSGTMTVLGDKKIAINTPLVLEDDDFHFFEETRGLIINLCQAVSEYLESDTLMLSEARQFLLDAYRKSDDELDRIGKLSEGEAVEEAIQLLEEKGHIVLSPPADTVSELPEHQPKEEPKESKIKSKKGSVNPDRYDEKVTTDKIEKEGDGNW